MDIKPLPHSFLPSDQPRCSAKLAGGAAEFRARTGAEPPYRCDMRATYSLDGVPLCRRHAAYLLLDAMTPPE